MKTLIDGREVESDSEAWRAECEARYVCRMDSQLARFEYIEGLKKKRGEEAAHALEELARAVWKTLPVSSKKNIRRW